HRPIEESLPGLDRVFDRSAFFLVHGPIPLLHSDCPGQRRRRMTGSGAVEPARRRSYKSGGQQGFAMLSKEQNDLITRVGPGTPAGTLMRRYWQPAALVDELAGNRPIKPLRLFGEDLVNFKNETDPYGLIGRR